MNCCFLANILMGTIHLFVGKFSYIVLNKAVYEKVVKITTKRRQCQNNPDVFCYICGGYIMAKYQFNVRADEAYFGKKLGDQDKSWALDKVCKHCTETLHFLTQGKVSSMRFGVPMVWCEPKITMMIVIFAWWICLDGISERRKIVIILMMSLLDDSYHIALKFRFQFSLPYLTLLQMYCY